MIGPYNISEVEKYLKDGAIGVYILSRGDNVAHYVGRSGNLKARLQRHGQDNQGYIHFWYEQVNSALEAYDLECELYHKYNPSDNENHPAIPPGSTWTCPVTGCPWST